MRQSPITRDTLIIADVDTKVKCRVPKLLLECFMRQLHNELIASPDYGGDRHHLAKTIFQCNNPTLTKENKLSHATSIGNKRKQT